MTKELLYLIAGMLLIFLPVSGYIAIKKLGLLETRPDQIIRYKKKDSTTLQLHYFKSKKPANKPQATILFFHGGAWQYGSPKAFYKHCSFFTTQGYHCISAQYRITSSHGTDPRAAVQDARSAMNYLVKNAQSLNIDSNHIYAAGGSAGGHLASILGIPVPLKAETPSDLLIQRPAGLILFNPMLDLSPCMPDHKLVKAFWQQVSPMQAIDNQVPDTLILVGDRDSEVSIETVNKFCQRMQKKNNRCETAIYPGARHGFFNYRPEDPDYFQRTNQRVLEFLDSINSKNGQDFNS